MYMMRKAFFFLFLLFAQNALWAETLFEKGEELFLANKPQEAVTYLEAALGELPGNEKIYLYLGIVYEQLGRRDEAITVMQKGLDYAKDLRHIFYFNIANNLYAKGDTALAEDMYSRSLQEKSGYSSAYLNRANARVSQKKYQSALSDYTVFLSLEPANPQADAIKRMVGLLRGIIAEQERAKLEEERRQAEELKAKAEEEKRLAEEQKKRKEEEERKKEAEARRIAEEQARQKALLDEVLKSLSNVSEDTRNLSAGSEDIQEFRTETDIED